MEIIFRETTKHYVFIIFAPHYIPPYELTFDKKWVIEQLKNFGKYSKELEALEEKEIQNWGTYRQDFIVHLVFCPKKPTFKKTADT